MSKITSTLSIIKPDGVKRALIGEIVHRFEMAGLQVGAMEMKILTQQEAETFYAIHKDRPFFGELVTFMTSGPVVIMALYGQDAVTKNREIMGATNPSDARCGTIRHDLSPSVGENTVHGSDSDENAEKEIAFFFPQFELP